MIGRLKYALNYCCSAFREVMILDRRQLYAAWEYSHLSRLLRHLQVDCVIDIGANEGQYARMLRQKTGYTGYIFSFEPIPAAAAIAREHAKGDDKWIIIETAIAEQDGAGQFNVMRVSQFSSLSAPRHDETKLFTEANSVQEKIEVRTERLETALRRLQANYQFKRPFLKMDTQGFDVRIVRNSQTVIRDFVGLQSELAVTKLYDDSVEFREALTEYQHSGFGLSAFVPNNAGHFPRLLELDCIMVRDDLLNIA